MPRVISRPLSLGCLNLPAQVDSLETRADCLCPGGTLIKLGVRILAESIRQPELNKVGKERPKSSSSIGPANVDFNVISFRGGKLESAPVFFAYCVAKLELVPVSRQVVRSRLLARFIGVAIYDYTFNLLPLGIFRFVENLSLGQMLLEYQILN